jgi:hypothetical protein
MSATLARLHHERKCKLLLLLPTHKAGMCSLARCVSQCKSR